jgi:hypothetical protein
MQENESEKVYLLGFFVESIRSLVTKNFFTKWQMTMYKKKASGSPFYQMPKDYLVAG